MKEQKDAERSSWLRKIIKLVNKGAKKLKEMTSTDDKTSEPLVQVLVIKTRCLFFRPFRLSREIEPVICQ